VKELAIIMELDLLDDLALTHATTRNPSKQIQRFESLGRVIWKIYDTLPIQERKNQHPLFIKKL
jgi:hypothetical protein